MFADLASDDAFRASHVEPGTYRGGTIEGEWVEFRGPDGTVVKAWLIGSRKPSERWLLVFHEWWGLNDHIRAEGARLWSELDSTNVLCLDMYQGKTSTDRNGAAALMGSLTKERTRSILEAAKAYLPAQAQVATIGWCMGGALSLQASITLTERGIGCVLFYGMPEEDPLKLAALNGPVLGLFAEEDAFINADVVARFVKSMAKAGKPLSVETFEADHAFANPSNPHHDAKATREANAMALAFLKKVFSGTPK